MIENTKIKKYIRISVLVFGSVIFVLFGTSLIAHAQSIDFPSNFADLSQQNLKEAIENIVRIVIGLIGIVFVLLILYGGLVWMTSQGEPDKIARAKKVIAAAVIGLLLTLAAYSIAGFIIRALTGALSPGGPGSSGPSRPGSFGYALGAGALESHYPGRGARDVPRNTNIFITFKEDIDLATVCEGGQVNTDNVKIIDAGQAVTPDPLDNDPEDNTLDVVSCSTTDNRTFKLDPGDSSDNHLGRSNQDVAYRVELGSEIRKADGASALGTLGYSWQFTVSSVIDETPPRVISVHPRQGQLVARNSLVEVRFSEPVDPSLTTGIAPGFANISLSDAGGALAGSYVASNQYRTVNFISNEACGINSCGGQVYCLPGGADVFGVVKRVITDMAGNMLDCGTGATCNATNDYIWDFDTMNALDLSPPLMTARVPRHGEVDADLEAPVAITFNKLIAGSSLRSSNVGFGRTVPYSGSGSADPVSDEGINYWISKEDIDDTSTVFINHDPLRPRTQYHPGVDSEITDIYQNCYYPAACDLDGNPDTIEACP